MTGFLTVVTMVVLGYGLTYFLWLQAHGLRLAARERHAAAAGRHTAPPAERAPMSYYLLVPCLDEEAVIGETVRNLLRFGQDATVVVVDDGSGDDTARVAREAGGERVVVLTRTAPDARQGKGAALNHALPTVVDDVRRRRLDAERVVVVVVDADGRLSPGAADVVGPLFDDARTAGVQLQVRIRNRSRTRTSVQDVGFWGTSSVAQMGRNATGSVSLGGNGQFTRLSALLSLPGLPWSDSLTEDLDLTISLLAQGWTTRQTSLAWVEQDAPETWRVLLRQRTRWAQGHMVCAGRIPELWRAREARTSTVLEMTLYLLQPWVLALSWSWLGPLLLALAGLLLVTMTPLHGLVVAAAVVAAVLVLAATPIVYGAGVYRARVTDVGYPRAVWFQVASLGLTLVTWVATWRALVRIVRGRTGWEKTVHNADVTPAVPDDERDLAHV